LAYDSIRGRVVLFGGSTAGFSGNTLAETWEWDGSSWVQRAPAISPPARAGHAMAFDSTRGRVVMFGGFSEGIVARPLGTVFVDTWEWDGSSWTQRAPTTAPPPRFGHAMAYDSARARVVLFGGDDRSGPGMFDDTWEWDGSSWVERAAGRRPVPRSYHAVAYDSGRGRTVLFGGRHDTGAWNDSTWEWDGNDWLNHATSPMGLRGHAMAYDGDRGRVMVFGGNTGGGPQLASTWEWDGSTWFERSAATRPPARAQHAMAYDSARGRVVLFGGAHTGDDGFSTVFLGDTWEWDGSAWTERSPAVAPAARYAHAMAYDSARGRIVLFGGRSAANEFLADTWEWDGTTWLERTPSIGPTPRRWPALAYDSSRGRVVLFGGSTSTNTFVDDTWEWDGSAWVERVASPRPSARHAAAMAYNSARGVMVLFGGFDGELTFGDTWEWDGSSWIAPDTMGPEPRSSHAMAYDSGRSRVVLFGGGGYLADTWEYSGCPGIELCNGLDEGADGCIPENELDLDGDGYVGCAPWVGSDPEVEGGGDCGQTNPNSHPGAPEICDGLDNDCNGVVPAGEADADGDGVPICAGDCDDTRFNCTTNCSDNNGNQVPDCAETCDDADGDGHAVCDGLCAPAAGDQCGDCDDSSALRFPGKPEICDGLDNDCANGVPANEADADSDTYRVCSGDCNDGDPLIHPARAELCNSLDDDCDSLVDEVGAVLDGDSDGVREACDNCPLEKNQAQVDTDADGAGDACDNCVSTANADQADDDLDLHGNACDNCRAVPNASQANEDADLQGDACDNCPSLANPDQADGDGELAWQWASSAAASSEYSSSDYSAMQAAGSPENAGVCEERPTNWSPLGSTADPEWLELTYSVPLEAIGVDVHESFEQGFVKQIELRDTSGVYHMAWAAADSTTCGDVLEARFGLTGYTVDRVRVRTAVVGWEEIDAVALVGLFNAAEGVGNACDNCPEHANPSQADFDGDGAGDVCDCAVTNSAARPAAEVEGLVIESPGAGVLRLSWQPAAGASSYEIVRGALSSLSATHMGECRASGITTLDWEDAEVPAAGQAFVYLVRGKSTACGPGTLGFGIYGLSRVQTGSTCPE
jgi:hypothetical protein